MCAIFETGLRSEIVRYHLQIHNANDGDLKIQQLIENNAKFIQMRYGGVGWFAINYIFSVMELEMNLISQHMEQNCYYGHCYHSKINPIFL